jgi:hypothetical protein
LQTDARDYLERGVDFISFLQGGEGLSEVGKFLSQVKKFFTESPLP